MVMGIERHSLQRIVLEIVHAQQNIRLEPFLFRHLPRALTNLPVSLPRTGRRNITVRFLCKRGELVRQALSIDALFQS